MFLGKVRYSILALFPLVGLCGCDVTYKPNENMNANSGTQGSASQEEQILFLDGMDAGLTASQQNGKPILVFFTAEWCEFCHQMEEEAFQESSITSLSQNFNCVIVNSDEETDLCSDFGISAFPTVQFLSPQGIPLNRIQGKKSANALYLEMQTALQAVALRFKATNRVIR